VIGLARVDAGVSFMTRYFHLTIVLALSLVGCEKHSASPSSSQMAYSNQLAAAWARAVQDGLTPSMSDEQILRAIGHDPALLTSHRSNGKDGYSMVYSNETTLIFITRSLVSGISVLRLKPEDQKQYWMLEKK